MKRTAIFAAMVALILSVSAPAFAMETAPNGADFGDHHATHAKDMGGFTADMNPGGMHKGFSGWSGM